MILYIENSKVCTKKKKQKNKKKLLEQRKELSKAVGYKINIKKSVAFLYTNKEQSER